jgi:hypothetical protein
VDAIAALLDAIDAGDEQAIDAWRSRHGDGIEAWRTCHPMLCETGSDGRGRIVSLGRDGKRGGDGDNADTECSPWIGKPVHPGECGCFGAEK